MRLVLLHSILGAKQRHIATCLSMYPPIFNAGQLIVGYRLLRFTVVHRNLVFSLSSGWESDFHVNLNW